MYTIATGKFTKEMRTRGKRYYFMQSIKREAIKFIIIFMMMLPLLLIYMYATR